MMEASVNQHLVIQYLFLFLFCLAQKGYYSLHYGTASLDIDILEGKDLL